MAKHAKKLSNTLQPKLRTLERADGTNTEVGEDTFNELMNSHLPNHRKAKHTTYNRSNKIKLTELHEACKGWINNDRIKLSLKGFQAKKSPGPDGIRPITFPHLPDNITRHAKLPNR